MKQSGWSHLSALGGGERVTEFSRLVLQKGRLWFLRRCSKESLVENISKVKRKKKKQWKWECSGVG